jgi:MoaD family protein
MIVNFYANFRSLVGGKSVPVDLPAGSRMREVLAALVERFPALQEHLLDESGGLLSHVHVFVNGRDILYLDQGLETILQPDDKLDIFPPVGGG